MRRRNDAHPNPPVIFGVSLPATLLVPTPTVPFLMCRSLSLFGPATFALFPFLPHDDRLRLRQRQIRDNAPNNTTCLDRHVML